MSRVILSTHSRNPPPPTPTPDTVSNVTTRIAPHDLKALDLKRFKQQSQTAKSLPRLSINARISSHSLTCRDISNHGLEPRRAVHLTVSTFRIIYIYVLEPLTLNLHLQNSNSSNKYT